MNGWMNEWMDEWMNEYESLIYYYTFPVTLRIQLTASVQVGLYFKNTNIV